MTVTMVTSRNHQKGLTLIEMMIAMAIGLVLVATVGYAYIGARQSFRTQDALSRIQENARYGFEFMAQDLRMAGSTGGARDGMTNIINTANLPAGVPATFVSMNPAIIGYDGSASPAVSPPGVCTTANTTACYRQGDSVTVVYADNEQDYRLDTSAAPPHDTSTRTFTLEDKNTTDSLAATHGLNVGDIMIAGDYEHTSIFQADSVGTTNVTYAAGGSMAPGNNATALGSFAADPGALRLYKLRAVTYYIAPNPAGVSSLYRLALGTTSGNASATAEELLEGVDNLTLAYGVDTNDPKDSAIDAYWTATQVNAGTDGTLIMPASVTTQAQRWQRVMSVRITLDMISTATGVSTRGDGRMRHTLVHVVTLRNSQWDPTW